MATSSAATAPTAAHRGRLRGAHGGHSARRRPGVGGWIALLAVALQGCALSAVNSPLKQWTPGLDEQWIKAASADRSDDLVVILAFSGGGTRAAAFSYGVMEELAATEIVVDGRERSLLDEVDIISGVSGGSFPAAYYGLYGDRIFTEFEPLFLRKDIEGELIARLFWPPNWIRLSSQAFGRSDLAALYYDAELFHGARFRDLRPGAPLIVLNSTDLATGSRFGFTQAYFDLLCSDWRDYPISHACAASSAVPVLLSPITLKSYQQSCGYRPPDWLESALDDRNDPRRQADARTLASYLDPKERRYAHLIDGGIADNLGLRAIIDAVMLRGDPEHAFHFAGHPHPHTIIIILVNAATSQRAQFALSAAAPTLLELINSVTSTQLENYDFETIELLRTALEGWTTALSEPGRPVQSAFVDVSFEAVPDKTMRESLNVIGTSFSLDEEDVDLLIETGRSLLRSDDQFEAVVRSLSPQAPVSPQGSVPAKESASPRGTR